MANIIGTAASESLTGTALEDNIQGLGGDDNIQGLGGDDVLIGGIGADTLVGGLGNDTYEVTDLGDVVTEQLGAGTDTVSTSLASYTLAANVENLTFGGSGNFTGTGNALDNRIVGGAGNDTLNGAAGNDVLIGRVGADTLIGGLGNDTYEVTDLGDVVTEQLGAGIDTVSTSLASYTLGANIENLTFGGIGNFTGIGNALGNRIVGGAGNDLLIGGLGADTLVGGTGNDTYEVTDLSDVVTEQLGAGSDTVSTTLANYTLAANVEILLFNGIGNFTGTGNALDNRIVGGAGNDTLNGAAGNDVLIGSVGADTLIGGLGNDTYEVTDLGDVVTEQLGAGTDTVSTSLASYTLAANVENLTFGGVGNFTGTGNALDNRIAGGAGNDTLNGAAGNDTVTGGAGNDLMSGALGNDSFVFALGFGNDTIQGFDADPAAGQDLLNIAGLGITSANFAANVAIAADGVDTVIGIGVDTIRLVGVSSAAIDQTDFSVA
jgi:Ca2+-binding RTX toxin-like protein